MSHHKNLRTTDVYRRHFVKFAVKFFFEDIYVGL